MLIALARLVAAFMLVGGIACALGGVLIACSAAFSMFDGGSDDAE